MSTESTLLMPRESGKLIAELAKDVSIKNDGIKKLAGEIVEELKSGELSVKNFSQVAYHPKPDDPRAADWIFVMDTLNFCFWTDSESKRWKVNGETGYFALCAAIKRALDAGIPMTDSTFLSKITRDELQKILKGDENCREAPLLIDERVKNLNDVGRVLIEKYNGTFLECIKSCNNSAEKLLKLIVEDFECFRDEANYQNHRVSFYKRAQILVGDIWACFQGKGVGAFHDIGHITMFADYRIPQVLMHFGAMQCTDSLTNKLLSGVNLQPGCVEEIEIRGCSIEAVERVVKEIKSLVKENPSLGLSESDCNAIIVDHFLWDYRRKHVEELDHIPYLQIKTIYY